MKVCGYCKNNIIECSEEEQRLLDFVGKTADNSKYFKIDKTFGPCAECLLKEYKEELNHFYYILHNKDNYDKKGTETHIDWLIFAILKIRKHLIKEQYRKLC